ncbi:MAG: GPW/gp25 family protein [Actinomycetota bacterium]
MPASDTRFGTDLRLLLDLEHVKSSRDPGHDLAIRRRSETGQVDLDTWSSVDNLVQALFLRFLTPAGELAILGHPDYGSRLHELIGELNTETNRNRAKLYVLQALAAEPRVQKVLSVKVTQSKRDRAQMDIAVSLLAIDSDTPLNLVFPFFLEGGAP